MPEIVSEIIDAYVFRIVDTSPEFLLLQRSPESALGGTWQAVHGMIEPGEKAYEAALREIREETGLTPVNFYQLDQVNTFYMAVDDKIHHCPCFAAEVAADAEVTLNEEHTDHVWLATDPAMTRFTWPSHRRALQEILAEIITPRPGTEALRLPI
jgi:dATP pyrophosphohydrolase